GGEESGHIIFLKWNTTGDGLMTAVHLAGVLTKSGKKLSELAKVMQTYPQVIVNAKVPNDRKANYESDAEVAAAIERVRAKFSENGRVVIRPSGTEPLIRVMIEGQDIEELTHEATTLAQIFESKLN
ncbi:MAG: phosphoglucosamine mutase, partial [Oscillospiraceae bacterium]|nr:phosphoglucosamine mutase [Oscillospiraceae bacterium]